MIIVSDTTPFSELASLIVEGKHISPRLYKEALSAAKESF